MFSFSFEFDLNPWGVDSAKKNFQKTSLKAKQISPRARPTFFLFSNLFPVVLYDRFVVFTSCMLHLI